MAGYTPARDDDKLITDGWLWWLGAKTSATVWGFMLFWDKPNAIRMRRSEVTPDRWVVMIAEQRWPGEVRTRGDLRRLFVALRYDQHETITTEAAVDATSEH